MKQLRGNKNGGHPRKVSSSGKESSTARVKTSDESGQINILNPKLLAQKRPLRNLNHTGDSAAGSADVVKRPKLLPEVRSAGQEAEDEESDDSDYERLESDNDVSGDTSSEEDDDEETGSDASESSSEDHEETTSRPSSRSELTKAALKKKRQQPLSSFFSKKPRLEMPAKEVVLDLTEEEEPSQAAASEFGESSSSSSIALESSKVEENIPECWTVVQYNYFKEKYDGLVISKRKLGCEYCAKHDFSIQKGVHVSKGWKNCEIMPSGSAKEVKQASLRKKMNEHFLSRAHLICKENIKEGAKDALRKSVEKGPERHLATTRRIFITVYNMAKVGRPFAQIEDDLLTQATNGLDIGIGLHSRRTAAKMVEFIAQDLKEKIFGRVIAKNLKICLIVDEVSTIASKPVVIVFLKVEGSGSDVSPTFFVELVELEKQDAETIFGSVMHSLKNVGFSKQYLAQNLIGFCSDGASDMLGRKSGVSTRMVKEFPNIIIWHCLNHRLQLVLDDAIKEVKQVNHFKIFIDKIYAIFHQSNKSQNELTHISEQLGIEILKIGRVLGPIWAACSLRSMLAVWGAYPALHQYFSSHDKFSGMAGRLENIYFFYDLALMIDILKEISLLSEAMQSRNIDVLRAEKYVLRSIGFFEMLKEEKGAYEKKVDALISSEQFKNIKFVRNQRFAALPRERLLESIIVNLKKRLMDCEHLKTGSRLEEKNKLDLLKYLDPQHWDIVELLVTWKDAEEQLLGFSEIFNYDINVNDYRDFVENVLKNPTNYSVPESIKKAQNIIRTIAVSSAEAERSFSKMNFICYEKRNRLTVSNISSVMTVGIIGLPVNMWDPIPTVKRWLQSQHRTADDARSLKHAKGQQPEDAHQAAIWAYCT